MSSLFFEKHILNSPYDLPRRHWELDASNQPAEIKVRPPTWKNLKCQISISSSHDAQHAAPYAYTERGVVTRSSVLNAPVRQVKVNCVDVFHPNSGEIRSHGADGIACWFIDTDYNEESFFVRHAYFLGASDPYKSLKTTLKADINAEAWESLHSDTSRAFDKPTSGRIAVKVINHLGDEVMKVFRV